jgi:hypothetical protein
MQAPKAGPEVRVTTQYWKGDVRICELDCGGVSLDIHLSQPEERWVFEGHSDRTAQAVVLSGSGPTRAAALADLARLWGDEGAARGLQVFDWKAVAEALRTVNIID